MRLLLCVSVRELTTSTLRSLLLAAFCAGCAAAEEPALAGGVRLAGTADAACRGDAGFSLSPDGQWLVFETLHSTPFDPRFVLLDLARGTRAEVAIPSAVRAIADQGRGPLAASACWGVDPTRIYFQGHGAFFVVEVGEGSRAMTLAERTECSPPLSLEGQIAVRQATPREAEIVLAGTVVAEHRAQRRGVTRIVVEHPAPSPDGRHLAYAVRELRGSFTAPPAGFVAGGSGWPTVPPARLGSPIYGPPRWAPDGSLFACLGRASDQERIVRWASDSLN